LQNVSHACRIMRVSRDTFYRVKRAYEEEGIEGLREKSRGQFWISIRRTDYL